jgi:alpha-L-fucosidase
MPSFRIRSGISLFAACGFFTAVTMAVEENAAPVFVQDSGGNPVQRWQDAKFGMFVHWGVYAVPAGVHNGVPIRHLGEWIMHHARIPKADYAKYAESLAPEGYDPAAWVGLAKEAGMKYMVVTAKHHDGFALFDSKVSGWNAVEATPAHRDLLMPIVEECRKQRMPLGFHYSQALDWWHPGGARFGEPWDDTQNGSFDEYLAKIAVPQIKELIANYGPVANLFFDTPVWMNAQRAAAIEAVLPPSTLTNDRLYGGSPGSYRSYENQVPRNPDLTRQWELCLSCNDTWGYKSGDENWKSSATLLRVLIDTWSLGGNVLLNVGPDANGRIPEPAVKALREIGAWLGRNGEAVYNTRRSPYDRIPWKGGCTTRTLPDGDSVLYAHLYDWPANRELRLPGLMNAVLSAGLLPDGPNIEAVRQGNSWLLRLPAGPANGVAVVKLLLKDSPVFENPAVEPASNGNLDLPAGLAVLSGKNLRLERQQNSPESNIGYWTVADDTVAWRLNLPASGQYECVWNMACDPKSAGSMIAIKNGGNEELGRFEVPATGGWGVFRQVRAGTLKLPAGLTDLRLVPLTKPGPGVVNLRSLSLEKTP